MNKYLAIIFSVIFFLIVFSPCQLLAASITQTKAEIGENCTASGRFSTAMGLSTTASGDYSTAMGRNTTASGDYSTAMGLSTTASGYNSLAGGKFMQLTYFAENSFVWGHADSAEYISTANTFLIFPAGTAGKVGIGTKSPQNLLDLGESHGKKLAVFQKTTGDDFYGFGISGNTLEFYAGAGPIASPAMVLKKSTGRVGIGTSDPGQKLDIAGGSGRVEPGYGWLTSSDQRLKKNISTLEGSLEKISRLRGVRFDTKETVYVDKSNGKHIGVIAQELEKEYPELVVGDKETGYKAVAYDKLTAVLIEAVKEMKAQNEKQQVEIEELRSMIKELKS